MRRVHRHVSGIAAKSVNTVILEDGALSDCLGSIASGSQAGFFCIQNNLEDI